MKLRVRDGETLINLEDFERVKQYNWFIDPGTQYVKAIVDLDTGYGETGIISMHQLIAGFPEGPEHHKNKDRRDNRRCNLKVMSHKEHVRLHRKKI